MLAGVASKKWGSWDWPWPVLIGSEPSPFAADDLGTGASWCVRVSVLFRFLFWSSLVIREKEAARVSEGQINDLITRSKMLLPGLILESWEESEDCNGVSFSSDGLNSHFY